MKVLVIGSSGQLARSLVEEASNKDMTLDAMGRAELDLEHPDIVKRLCAIKKPDVVVNAAAYTAVDRAESEPDRAMAVNADGVEQLASFCEQYSIPLVHISTDYVFDGSNIEPYSEADPVYPLGVYGRSKLEGERRVAKACSRHIILRTAWVFSPFGNNFVKTMLRLARTGNEISVVADQIGNPTYAPHLAQAILSLVYRIIKEPSNSEIWGIFHATAAGEASWYDFACEIFRQAEKFGQPAIKIHPISSAQYPTPATRPANSRLDCSKLHQVFGLKLPDWREGTTQCVSALMMRE